MAEMASYARNHLDDVVGLCRAEGWPSLPADAERAHRVLTNPGVTTVVALDESDVVGFASMLSDGEIQAFLSVIAVAASHRRQGIGRRLLSEVFRSAGGQRVDLLSSDDAFYSSFQHVRWNGYRIYPEDPDRSRG